MSIEKRLERLEAILDARGLDWDHPRVEEEPANEPPKKWRILEPGEVVCSSDWICARSNLPSDPPNGLGWKPQIFSTGISVSKYDECIFARPGFDEPAKEPSKQWRILEPGEVVQEGDWMNARVNWQEDGPPGAGWVAASSFYFGKDASVSSGLYFSRHVSHEPANEPEPAWEPKVGDWVKVTRPEDWIEWRHPRWEGSMHKSDGMHKFDGQVGQIEREREGHFQIRGFVASKECSYIFHRNWLSPAKPPEPAEPEYREPVLPADLGKWAEFSHDGINWIRYKLRGCHKESEASLTIWSEKNIGFRHCRIKKDA